MPRSLSVHPSRARSSRSLSALFICIALAGASSSHAAAQAAAPDVIVFTNGDQLTGKFLRSTGGNVTFHSDIAGDVNVGWDKVKELRSASTFAVFEKGVPLTKTPENKVPQGTVSVKDQQLEVKQASGDTRQVPVKDAEFVIDEATFQQQVRHEPSLLRGWVGTMSAGATLVRATQNTTTYNGALTLVRAIPEVSWLSARNRTTLDFNGSYGKITQPQATGAPRLPDLKTDIYHADAERDQYFSPRFYVLAQTAFDHNFSQGLELQQIYGAGVGATVVKQPRQTLDIKATV